jgi:hypothetical protein
MITRFFLIVLCAGLLWFTGCTEEKKQPEQQPASTQAELVGKEAAAAIKTPIDKAETVTGLQNEHNKALEDQAKTQ